MNSYSISKRKTDKMRGLVIYGREGYEDGGEFVAQVDRYAGDHDDVKIVLAEDLTLAIQGREVAACLPDGTIISRDANRPEWVMMRATDWKSALAFEMMGVQCFPPSNYILAASDKVVSHLAMADCLTSPNTLLRRGCADVSEIPTPYIIKASEGFGGKTVHRIDSALVGEVCTVELEACGENLIYQKPAASPDDLRVYVMGREIMFAILRKAQAGSDKANFCQGAVGFPYVMSETEMEQVQRAIDSFDCDLGFVSIDFLFDDAGNLLFNEMNCFPGLAGLVQMGWHEDFVENYVNHIEKVVNHEV